MSENLISHTSDGLGIANTALLGSLFDHLIARQNLSQDEVRDILAGALAGIGPRDNLIAIIDAHAIIDGIAKKLGIHDLKKD